MDIIQQIAAKMIEQVFEKIRLEGLSDIGKTIKALQPIVSDTILKIIRACIEAMDNALVDDAKAQRRKDGITVKERNVERTFQTDLGDLKYNRTYFKLKDGNYAYLLDQIIGVEPYERISKDLIAGILESSASQSYQRAVESSGQDISRQTVHNRLLAIKEVVTEIKRTEETPKTLDMFADEDHVHLNPKGSAMVPLVTITEGIDTSNPKRHHTINPLHMAEYGMQIDAFRDNVVAVLCQRYDLEKVRQINIHADGGTWIQELAHIIPNSRMAMDGFHLEKRLKAFLHLEGARSYAGKVREALKDVNGLETLKKYCDAISQKQTTEDNKTKVNDFYSYCSTHWKSIVLRMNKEVCGSCTEPLVGHTLSGRLSRNPISWSKDGLSKMTMVVAYTKNGNHLSGSDIRIRPDKETVHSFEEDGYAKYNDYAVKQANDFLNSVHDWSLFDSPGVISGKVDGTYMLRKSFGSFRSLADLAC